MALVKFGGGVSEMRGKEAGLIFSRNAYGSYVKQKVSPVNPQTGLQLAQRTLMGNAAQTWAGLSAANKASWDNLGSQVTRVNRFGDTTAYTGFSLFMKLNRNAVLAGGSMQSAAPTVPTIPTLAITSLVVDLSSSEMIFTLDPAAYTGYVAAIYATNNILTGRRFVKNFYRFLGVTATSTSPFNALTIWTAVHQNAVVVGAKIFAKVKLIHIVSGFEGVPATVEATVIA
jgi:hypothetical protein